jgi:hypothetical protein
MQTENLIPTIDVTEAIDLDALRAAGREGVEGILASGKPYLMIALNPSEEGSNHQSTELVATCDDGALLVMSLVTLGLLGMSRIGPEAFAAMNPAQQQAMSQMLGLQMLQKHVAQTAEAQLNPRTPAQDVGAEVS